jgi:hypothetical protein
MKMNALAGSDEVRRFQLRASSSEPAAAGWKLEAWSSEL